MSRCQRVPGGGVGQFGDGDDVPRRCGIEEFGLLADHRCDLRELLVGARSAVRQHNVGLEGPRANPHQRDLADVRVGDRLEHKCEWITGRIRRDFDRLVAGGHRHRWAIGGRRAQFGNEVGESIDGDWAGRRATDHREDGCRGDSACHGVLELIDGGNVSVEVALEHVIVCDNNALDEVVVDFVFAVRHRLGDFDFFGMPGVVDVGLVTEEIRNAVEVGLFADRQLDGGNSCSKSIPELTQRSIERGAFLVEFVDEDHPGNPVIFSNTPRVFRLNLDAFDC